MFGGSSSHPRHIREGKPRRKWHHQRARWLAGSEQRDLQTDLESARTITWNQKEETVDSNLKIYRFPQLRFQVQMNSWPDEGKLMFRPLKFFCFYCKKKQQKRNFRKSQTQVVFSHHVSIWENVEHTLSECSAKCVMLMSAGGGANRSDLHHHQGELGSAWKPAASSPDWPSHTFKPWMCPADNVSVSLALRSIRTRAGGSGFWLALRLSNFLQVQKSIQETGAGVGQRCLESAEKLNVLFFVFF